MALICFFEFLPMYLKKFKVELEWEIDKITFIVTHDKKSLSITLFYWLAEHKLIKLITYLKCKLRLICMSLTCSNTFSITDYLKFIQIKENTDNPLIYYYTDLLTLDESNFIHVCVLCKQDAKSKKKTLNFVHSRQV